MDYALALELKKAKFPFKVGLDNHGYGIHFGDTVLYCPPTLEELVDACGDDFALLLRGAEGRWFAQGFGEGTEPPSFLGATPSEAVARLWLFANKPHN